VLRKGGEARRGCPKETDGPGGRARPPKEKMEGEKLQFGREGTVRCKEKVRAEGGGERAERCAAPATERVLNLSNGENKSMTSTRYVFIGKDRRLSAPNVYCGKRGGGASGNGGGPSSNVGTKDTR